VFFVAFDAFERIQDRERKEPISGLNIEVQG